VRTFGTGSCSSMVTMWGDSGRCCSGCCTGSRLVQWPCIARGSALAMACRQLSTAVRTREDLSLRSRGGMPWVLRRREAGAVAAARARGRQPAHGAAVLVACCADEGGVESGRAPRLEHAQGVSL